MSSELAQWLETRSPPPPEDLRRRLEAALSEADGPPADATPSSPAEALRDAAAHRLSEARRRPGRVRETAFDLLVADALLTYACEAALTSESPEDALESMLALGEGT